MTDHRRVRCLLAVVLLAAVTLVGCGASTAGEGETADRVLAGEPGATGDTSTGELSSFKVAAVFSGPVTDHNYNELGLLGLQAAADDGAAVTYTDNVPVPDAERVIRDYVAAGNTVIWTHGSQFYDATAKVAADNPSVRFIGEFDGQPGTQPPNMWILDRRFHLGFYAIGVLAAKLSHTGKIGYVGGLSLPFSYSEVHAMNQAIDDLGLPDSVNAVWTGDFNDPAKAQQITAQLIADGSDVIVGSLNNGAVGIFRAAASAKDDVWVTAKYTDKFGLDQSGDYAGTVLYDFTRPLEDVLTKIRGGEDSGYYPLGFSTGVTISMPDDVPADVRAAVTDTMTKVDDGTIEVVRDTSKISK
jgi:basic membrane protein A and related proteins